MTSIRGSKTSRPIAPPRVARFLGTGEFTGVIDLAYDWQRGTTPAQVEAAARAAAAGPLTRYVFVSSISAYGSGLDLREEDPLAPDDTPNSYARNKAGAERALFRLHAETGFPAATVRPPFVHGAHQPFYWEQFFWDRLRDGRLIVLPDGGGRSCTGSGPATSRRPASALEMPAAAGEAFNIGHAEPVTQRELVAALARVAGVEPELVPVSREATCCRRPPPGAALLRRAPDLPAMTASAKVTRLPGWPLRASRRLPAGWEYLPQPRRPVDYRLKTACSGGAEPSSRPVQAPHGADGTRRPRQRCQTVSPTTPRAKIPM